MGGRVGVDEGEEAGDEAVEDRSVEFVALVKGAKRSGKSTFAREAVNRLLAT
jgi:polynucleotide 5'-kinase involved in rRNA processing